MDFLISAPLNPGNGGGGNTSTIAYVAFGALFVAVVVFMFVKRRKE